MEFLVASFIAGVLTILAPCSVTLLPVMLSGSVTERNPWRPLVVALSLGISVFIFTLLFKVGTEFLPVDESMLKIAGGVLIFLLGLTMIFPSVWDHIQVKLGLYKTEALLEKTNQNKGFGGSIALGAALGPVFSTCSPTYFFILGTILPASLAVGLLNLGVYSLGLIVMLLAVGYGGRAVVMRFKFAANPQGWFKRLLGVILVIVGFLFLTGLDKTLETAILDAGDDTYILVDIEQSLIKGME